ncbi:MAG: TetR/AcrR family transcriptional regulator [Lachnospiraceae bacterium]|nr:TetR/AcrR family transcriptional regulator [Lachnospiraceae bacterium]
MQKRDRMIAASLVQTKNLMIRTARELAVETGFENFRIKKWADEAKISEGILYYHFESKEELLRTVYQESDSLIKTELLKIIDRQKTEGDRRTLGRRVFEEYLQFLHSHMTETLYCRMYRQSGIYSNECSAYEEDKRNFMKQLGKAFSTEDERTQSQLAFFFSELLLSFAASEGREEKKGSGEYLLPVRKLLTETLNLILQDGINHPKQL